jgi:hypothetical protein
LTVRGQGGSSSAVYRRVTTVRRAERLNGTRLLTNADMQPAEVRHFCTLELMGSAPSSGKPIATE